MTAFDERNWRWREVHVAPAQVPSPRPALGKAIELLAPFAVAGLLFLWGNIIIACVAASVGVFLAGCKWLAPSWHSLIFLLLTSLGRWLSRAVSRVALSIVYFLVFMPAALLARLTGRDELHLRRPAHCESYWVNIPAYDRRRVFAKPFFIETVVEQSRTGGRVFRVGRSLAFFMFILVAVNWGGGFFYHWATKQSHPLADHEDYRNLSWAATYWREHNESSVTKYRPFVGWSRLDYKGQYVNITDGCRKTFQSAAQSDKPTIVYVFGGSTIWGTGARDDYTIPSCLTRIADQQGIPLRVSNFGEAGYVNWQNVIHLAELCANGQVPDLVIFYEGCNDAIAKLQTPELERVHQNFSSWERRNGSQHRHLGIPDEMVNWLSYHSLARMVRDRILTPRTDDAPQLSPDQLQHLAAEVVETYEENARFVRALGERYGFQSRFFWQPIVYTKSNPSQQEQSYRTSFGEPLAEIYRIATARIRESTLIHDLSKSYDGADKAVYIDFAHVSEEGNAIIAAKIFDRIEGDMIERIELAQKAPIQ